LEKKVRKVQLWKVILVLDNYDSFTYNLVHYLEEEGLDFEVRRNDALRLEQVAEYESLLISPGPGLPSEAGILPELVSAYHGKKKMLGVCLGMQAICEFKGFDLVNMQEVLHGRQTEVEVDPESILFRGLPPKIQVGRYHSWAIRADELNGELVCTSTDSNGFAMAVEDPTNGVFGLQFHPESIMTPDGKEILRNWLAY
jgi:anthranilate synthase component 2